MRWSLPAAVMMAPIALSGCAQRIAVPLQACVVQGSRLTHTSEAKATSDPGAIKFRTDWYSSIGTFVADSVIQALVDAANDTTWIPDANIAFLLLPDTVGAGFYPVVPDPHPPNPTPGLPDRSALGDISLAGLHPELDEAIENCKAQWVPMGTSGTPLLIVRHFVDENGDAVTDAGVSRGPNYLLTAPGGFARLCTAPRTLSAADMKDGYSALEEPAAFAGLAPWTWVFLAHELGHTLLLSHGDGLDNDGNGVPLGTSGPRLFDQGCDPPEFQSYDNAPEAPPTSLMDPVPPVSHLITPLQREAAREAAVHAPGALGGPP
jgi:hypothetical protein